MSRSFPLSVHSWADAAVSSCFLVVSESPNPEVPPHMSGSVINADSSCHQTQAPLSVHLFNITGALAQQAHGRRYHPPITRPVRLPCARSAKNAVLFGTRSVEVTFFTKNHSKNVAGTITFLFLFGSFPLAKVPWSRPSCEYSVTFFAREFLSTGRLTPRGQVFPMRSCLVS